VLPKTKSHIFPFESTGGLNLIKEHNRRLIIKNIVLSSLISLIFLFVPLLLKQPGIFVTGGNVLIVIFTLMIHWSHREWENTKKLKSQLRTMRMIVYGLWYSLFYLASCIYLLLTDDPVVNKFNMPIATVMSIILLIVSITTFLKHKNDVG
jgi:multisubunit Na+/H+ antiporter MnhB subunit